MPVPTHSTCTDRARQAVVVGAGLSGAACAWSLAQRGWQVTVLDKGAAPAAGASGLPVGLVVPHTSADDTLISQISRVGIRHTLGRAAQLLRTGQDWAPSGVLEHCVEGSIKLPPAWADAEAATRDAGVAPCWSVPAEPGQIHAGGLAAPVAAIWHGCAAWVKPPALVTAMLQHANIRFVGGCAAHALHQTPHGWVAADSHGHALAQGRIVVLAAGFDSAALLAQLQQASTDNTLAQAALRPLPLNPLRGQVAWGWMPPSASGLPPFPVNGKGSMAAHIPYAESGRAGTIWITGSTFQRGETDPTARAADMPQILAKLRVLHPAAAQALQSAFETGQAQGWAGVRATLPDRLPAVGPWPGWQGLYLCCGMGARGLALAVLSGELLAAGIEQQALPLPDRLAGMLAAARWQRKVPRQALHPA